MKCPACFNELSEIQVGPVLVDVCQGGCGGVWFDPFELKKMDEHSEAGEPLLHLKRDPSVTVDPSRKRSCPRCLDIKLRRHFFSPKQRVEVDECPNCGGYWLDAGELERIRSGNAAAEREDSARQSTISTEFIRYIYRLEVESRPR